MTILGSLLNQHAIAERTWTPATDGLSHDIAQDIKEELIRAGLDESQASYLMGRVL